MVSLQFSLPGVESPNGAIGVFARVEEIAVLRDTPVSLFIGLEFLFVNHAPEVSTL
jgi:hypothetical protein